MALLALFLLFSLAGTAFSGCTCKSGGQAKITCDTFFTLRALEKCPNAEKVVFKNKLVKNTYTYTHKHYIYIIILNF